jgi:hypothetical protein
MNTLTPDRGKLIEAINKLPMDVLPELADYLSYLQFKIKSVAKPEKTKQKSDFLLSIAGLGEAEEDLSERDEEILVKETDPMGAFPKSR